MRLLEILVINILVSFRRVEYILEYQNSSSISQNIEFLLKLSKFLKTHCSVVISLSIS